MSEQIEYIIICMDGITHYSYEYSDETFYGTVSSLVDKWETCSKSEYDMLVKYAQEKSTGNKKYMVIRKVFPVENNEKPDFSLSIVKDYYRKIEEARLQKIINDEAKRLAAAETRKQNQIKKLMKELGLSEEEVKNIINKKKETK